MTQIAAPAHITADQPQRTAVFKPSPFFKRVRKFLTQAIIRIPDDDIGKLYEGSSWCDQTERDLNNDVITGRRTRRS